MVKKECSRDLGSISTFAGNDVEFRGIIGARNKRRLGLTLKHSEDGFAIEKKEGSDLAFVLGVAVLALLAKAEQCFITAWVFFYPSFFMENSRNSAEITNPSLRWAVKKSRTRVLGETLKMTRSRCFGALK